MPTTWTKFAGETVFPPHDDPEGACTLTRLLHAEPWRASLQWEPGFAGGIAHRLDTSTSGALILADDPADLERIRAAFRDSRLRKTYRLIAARPPRWSTNICAQPIAHAKRNKRRMIVQRGANTPHRGKWYPAHTEFRQLSGPLLEAVITTGVMHQIRVHAAFVGIPLLGDRLYGGGAPPEGQDEGITFRLHHVGATCADGWSTSPVDMPTWATPGTE